MARGTYRNQNAQIVLDQQLDRRLLAYVGNEPSSDPPLPDDILQPFMDELQFFLESKGYTAHWSVREHQPMRLNILHALSNILWMIGTLHFLAPFKRE